MVLWGKEMKNVRAFTVNHYSESHLILSVPYTYMYMYQIYIEKYYM